MFLVGVGTFLCFFLYSKGQKPNVLLHIAFLARIWEWFFETRLASADRGKKKDLVQGNHTWETGLVP